MADYSRQLFDMFGSIGDQVVDNRKESEGKRRYEESAARQMFNDEEARKADQRNFEYRASRDQVGDGQWSQEFGANQSYRGQSLALQREKMAQDVAGAESYGLTPVWGTDAQGKPALVQLGKGGQPIQPKLPEGFQIARDPIKMDAGTHFVLLDPQTRQQIGTIPKDVSGEAAANVVGKAQGEAQSQLGAAGANTALVSSQVDSLANDEYLPSMVGPVNGRLPNLSGDAARVQGKMDQVQGGAFLQARQMLKGGGAITDYEGAKAEAAFARMGAAQSYDDYKAALNEFKGAVQQGYAKLQAQAGGGQKPAQSDGGWQTMGNGVKMRQVR